MGEHTRRDVIIVDTSGRHRQEAALFEEMRQVCGPCMMPAPASSATVPF